MRSHRRRQPLERVLIAGDLGDLGAIQQVLAGLSPAAYGQVFVETGGADVPLLDAPARVSVHLLGGRASEGTAPVLAARGTALVEAIETWISEWLPTGLAEADTAADVQVWLGGRACDAMTELYRSLPVLAQRL